MLVNLNNKGVPMSFSQWLKGLRGKMLLIVIIPAMISGGVCFFSLGKLTEVTLALEKQTGRITLATNDGELNSNGSNIFRWIWATLGSTEKVERKSSIEKAKKSFENFQMTATTKYDGLQQLPEAKAMTDSIASLTVKFEPSFKKAVELLDKNTIADDALMKEIVIKEMRPIFKEIEDTLDKLNKVRAEGTKKTEIESAASAKVAHDFILFGSILGTILGALIGIYLAARISKQLGEVSGSLGGAGQQVSAASEQLSTASQKLSESTTESAAAIEETASSLEEFSSMVKQNADHAREANRLSQAARQAAEIGETEVKELMSSIGSIVTSSKKIEEIISVIDGIAFQTNLLALNAAVEAARAGEHGKGFAVVAEAVRNLAQRSADAAKDISTLIKENVSKSDDGSKVAAKSATALKDIVTNVKKVSDLIAEIASASQEQAQGVEQIAKAINQVDQTTQSNAATSEESAAASEELSAQAISLGEMVIELVTIVNGGTGGANNQPHLSSKREYVAQQQNKIVNIHQRNKPQKYKAPLVTVKSKQNNRAEEVIPFEGDEPEETTGHKQKLNNVSNF